MINSINLQKIRQLCDKVGYTSRQTEYGDVLVVFDGDERFGNNIGVFFGIDGNNWLQVRGLGGIEIKQDRLAEAIKRINIFNFVNRLMTAYISESGTVIVERYELIDEDVSEEFVLENVIKLSQQLVVDFFRENFADFV